MTVMYLYARKGERQERVAHNFCLQWWRPAVLKAFQLDPRFVPSSLFLACLSPLACGLRAAVWSLQVDETRDTNAYSACGLTNWSSWV